MTRGVALDHRDDEVLRDGHGDKTYTLPEPVVELHRAVVAAGWEHEYHPTSPYENLAALLATVDDLDGVDPERGTVETFAYRYICGYGPHSTPGALDALADDPDVDATVPGGDQR